MLINGPGLPLRHLRGNLAASARRRDAHGPVIYPSARIARTSNESDDASSGRRAAAMVDLPRSGSLDTNPAHHTNRQRFTIAHVGHYFFPWSNMWTKTSGWPGGTPIHQKRSTGWIFKQTVLPPELLMPTTFLQADLDELQSVDKRGRRIVREEVHYESGCDENTFVAARYRCSILKRARGTRFAKPPTGGRGDFANREPDSLFCLKFFPVLLCGFR